MAKRIKNPIEVKFILIDEQIEPSLQYGLECEHGSLPRNSFTPELTTQEQALIEQIVNGAIVKIKEHEEITE